VRTSCCHGVGRSLLLLLVLVRDTEVPPNHQHGAAGASAVVLVGGLDDFAEHEYLVLVRQISLTVHEHEVGTHTAAELVGGAQQTEVAGAALDTFLIQVTLVLEACGDAPAILVHPRQRERGQREALDPHPNVVLLRSHVAVVTEAESPRNEQGVPRAVAEAEPTTERDARRELVLSAGGVDLGEERRTNHPLQGVLDLLDPAGVGLHLRLEFADPRADQIGSLLDGLGPAIIVRVKQHPKARDRRGLVGEEALTQDVVDVLLGLIDHLLHGEGLRDLRLQATLDGDHPPVASGHVPLRPPQRMDGDVLVAFFRRAHARTDELQAQNQPAEEHDASHRVFS
jgi:hypothetical protein